MEKKKMSRFSNCLGRNMNIMVYGSEGTPLIAFPCQDGMCDNWESFHMPDEIGEFIENGKIQLFCVDTVDRESWSDNAGNGAHRAWIQEQYYHYICDEAVPYIASLNGSDALPILAGCSLGATHAAICFLRRPELFSGMIALSGCYDADFFWHGFSNRIVYDNNPVLFLSNLPEDHPYIELYNKKKIVFCVGQGAWEEEGIRTTGLLKDIFERKGIHAWCDFWGYDVNHDWPWWYKQMRYFLPYVLGEKS